MKKIALSALLCGFIATPALAEKFSPVYVEAGLGHAVYTDRKSPNVARIAAGVRFTPMVAAEIGFSSFNYSVISMKPDSNFTFRASSVQAALVGNYPVNQEFDFIAKFGIDRNTTKISTQVPAASATQSNRNWFYSFGGEYHINKSFSLRGTYDDYGFFIDGPTTVPVTAFSLALHYNF